MAKDNQIDVIGLGASTVDILTLIDHFPTRRETQGGSRSVVAGRSKELICDAINRPEGWSGK